ncbi:aspartate/glutamate racemase family protein [Olsenella urininfantis]|uniref:aspartate/glutamate racemase family protein n=1 Tax=Olsenella urininfantis TaxID=1871033 RepID=UPI0009873F79|nr:aspartate/glutamate racemase family protein [Olsenella urininfantis]
MRKIGIVACGRGLRLDEFPAGATVVRCDEARLRSLAEEGRLDEMAELILGALRSLAGEGCELAALTGSDAHLVFSAVRQLSPVPLVSMVEACRERILAQGFGRAMLLGSALTLRRKFFKSPIVLAHVPVVVPGGEDARWLDEFLAGEGAVDAQAIERFRHMVAEGMDHGAEVLVLSDPALLSLAEASDATLPVIDAAQVQREALLLQAL